MLRGLVDPERPLTLAGLDVGFSPRKRTAAWLVWRAANVLALVALAEKRKPNLPDMVSMT
jgi:hypothetical protein